ncbi:hypothetical protein Noda2021_00520 [Candidatus Dependentiae bacterium Noda2021]|nr:hypothetical protein Noda2021_00520 [Candidatus Dependentiae bacterium Noda2021]
MLCVISCTLRTQSPTDNLHELARMCNELHNHMQVCAQYKAIEELTPLFLTPQYRKELQEIGPMLAQSCTKKDELLQLLIALEQKLLAEGIPAAFIEQLVVTGALIKQH